MPDHVEGGDSAEGGSPQGSGAFLEQRLAAQKNAADAEEYAHSWFRLPRWSGITGLFGLGAIAAACAPTLPPVENPNLPAHTAPADPSSRLPDISSSAPKLPEATPTLAPGVGGTERPLYREGHPYAAALNAIIQKLNSGAKLTNEEANRLSLAAGAESTSNGQFLAIDGSVFYKKDAVAGKESPEYAGVPKVPGLQAVIEQGSDGKTFQITYKADRDNSFGLLEGENAGMFYQQTYEVGDPKEPAKQVGAVVVRAEVAKVLAKTMFANEPLSFPLGIDPTTADDNDKRLLLQDVHVIDSGRNYLYIKAPSDSVLTNNVMDTRDSSVIWVTRQKSGNSTIGVAPGRLPGQWTLDVAITTSMDPAHPEIRYGGQIVALVNRSFIVADSRKPFIQPSLVSGANVSYSMSQRVVDEATAALPFKQVTTENIWRIGGHYVALMSNQSPLITSK